MPIVYTDMPGSSALQRIGYDVLTGELRVVFRKQKAYPEYIFGGVPPGTVDSWFLSGSKGRFYHAYIKGRYRVRPAAGSFRLSAVGRGVTTAPGRAGHYIKKALKAVAEISLIIK